MPETRVWVFMTLWRMVETATFLFVVDAFWKQEVNTCLSLDDRTHVKDLKSLFEVRPPGRGHLFFVLRVEVSRDHIPFTPLD